MSADATNKIPKNESYNMKLKATYVKTLDGRIEVKIVVVDSGNFPSCKVFSHYADPTDAGYKLSAGDDLARICTLPTAEDAKRWVAEQVEALRRHLNAWRAIQVPPDEELWI